MTGRIRFDPAGVAAWTQFSGDNNPIHFDSQLVNDLFGISGIAVPGMLAILPYKQLTTEVGSRGEWLRWTAVMRRVVPTNVDCQIRIKRDGLKGRFSLDNEMGKAYLSGSWETTDLPSSAVHCGDKIALADHIVASRMLEFKRIYRDIDKPWIALDSIIFSLLFEKYAFLFLGEETSEFDAFKAGGFALLAKHCIPLQTSHSCLVSAKLRDSSFHEFPQNVQYSAERVAQVYSEVGVFSVIKVSVWIGTDLAMIVEVGSAVKKSLDGFRLQGEP